MTVESTHIIQRHVDYVNLLMKNAVSELLRRASVHDSSKFVEPEKPYYDYGYAPDKQHPFGTPEYYAVKKEMAPGINHHYANNDHHPEYFPNGMAGMSLFSIMEMAMDWLAASDYSGREDGDIFSSVDHLQNKFGFDDMFKSILINTYLEMREKNLLPERTFEDKV